MTDFAVRAARDNIVLSLLKRFPMEIIFLCLVVILVAIAPGFSTTGNLLNVLRTISMLGIIAFGMTAVIIAGEIDLSVGSGAALAGCIVAWFAGAYSDSIGAGLAILLGDSRGDPGRLPDRLSSPARCGNISTSRPSSPRSPCSPPCAARPT